jgi:hypothetical protein
VTGRPRCRLALDVQPEQRPDALVERTRGHPG